MKKLRRAGILDNGSLKIQNNRNRYYDYYTGRWLTHDPFGYFDGMSLYEYIKGIPTIDVDPYGLSSGCMVECILFKVKEAAKYGLTDPLTWEIVFQCATGGKGAWIACGIVGSAIGIYNFHDCVNQCSQWDFKGCKSKYTSPDIEKLMTDYRQCSEVEKRPCTRKTVDWTEICWILENKKKKYLGLSGNTSNIKAFYFPSDRSYEEIYALSGDLSTKRYECKCSKVFKYPETENKDQSYMEESCRYEWSLGDYYSPPR